MTYYPCWAPGLLMTYYPCWSPGTPLWFMRRLRGWYFLCSATDGPCHLYSRERFPWPKAQLVFDGILEIRTHIFSQERSKNLIRYSKSSLTSVAIKTHWLVCCFLLGGMKQPLSGRGRRKQWGQTSRC